MLMYEMINRRGENALQVAGSTGPVRDLTVPEAAVPGETAEQGPASGTGEEKTDLLPVRSIGGHAFAGRKELRTVSLPETLKTIRSFAFYDCPSLLSMELYNTTDDYYDGVIRQCPSLRLITVHCTIPENFIIVREMLSDVDGTLRFRLLTKEGELRLVFPEYVSEAREDTMARAIHFSIEGAGMAYRECVGKKSIDLAGYDRLLDRLTDYDFVVAAEIALGRLSCPAGLSEEAEKGYQDFLKENDGKTLAALIRRGDSAEELLSVQVMTDRKLIREPSLGPAMELASENGRVRIESLLMDYRNRTFPAAGSRVFRLEW